MGLGDLKASDTIVAVRRWSFFETLWTLRMCENLSVIHVHVGKVWHFISGGLAAWYRRRVIRWPVEERVADVILGILCPSKSVL